MNKVAEYIMKRYSMPQYVGKKFIVKPKNRWVYHVSNPYFRKSIKLFGLTPDVGDTINTHDGDIFNYKPSIYATDTNKYNELFDQDYNDDIWAIDTTKINNVWYEDSNFTFQENNVHMFTLTEIPTTALKLIYEGTGEDYDTDEDLINRKKYYNDFINNDSRT